MFYQILPSDFAEGLNGLVYFSYLWLPEFCSVSDLGASISLPPSPYLLIFTRRLRLIPDDGTILPLSPRPPEITWITCWSVFFRHTLKAAISWSSPVWEKSTRWTHLTLFRTAQPTCSRTQLLCLVVWDTPVILLLVPGWSHPVIFTRSITFRKVKWDFQGHTLHGWHYTCLVFLPKMHNLNPVMRKHQTNSKWSPSCNMTGLYSWKCQWKSLYFPLDFIVNLKLLYRSLKKMSWSMRGGVCRCVCVRLVQTRLMETEKTEQLNAMHEPGFSFVQMTLGQLVNLNEIHAVDNSIVFTWIARFG